MPLEWGTRLGLSFHICSAQFTLLCGITALLNIEADIGHSQKRLSVLRLLRLDVKLKVSPAQCMTGR